MEKTFCLTLMLLVPAVAHAAPRTQPNGFDVYLRAATSIRTAKPPVDPVNDSEVVTDPKIKAERYSLARKEAWLKQNAAGFALFKQAQKLPVHHPGPEAKGGFLAVFPAYSKLRQLARNKTIEANAHELGGDWNGAVQSRLDIVQMGTDIGQGGPLIASLVAVAIQAIGRNNVWDQSEHLNASEARAAAMRLEELYGRRLRFSRVLQDEKAWGLQQMDDIVRRPNWRDPQHWSDLSLAGRVDLLTVSPATLKKRYNDRMDRQIRLARLPYSVPRRPVPSRRGTLDALFTSWERGGINFARNDTGNAVWMTVLALRAYKLERGSYPAALSALVPGYLHRVPLDPFSGVAPLHYKRSGHTYVLWSIGPDGVDNGGRPIQWSTPRTTPPGEKPPLPFMLLDSKGDYVAGKNR